jgi:integrase
VTTGLRINELLALKTESGRRRIRLTSIALDALREHRKCQIEERLALGDAWQDLGYIFASSIGTALDDSNVRKQYYALIKHAGLPQIVFHDLRHSAASWLIAHGVPVNVVSEILGHADPSITMRIYAHALPNSQDRVAAALESLLQQQPQVPPPSDAKDA